MIRHVLRALAVPLAVAAAVRLGGAPRDSGTSAEPLQESKKALRELQREERERGQEGSSSRAAAIDAGIAAPQKPDATLPLTLAIEASKRHEEEKKSESQQRNWLVDGVGRLDADRTSERSARGRSTSDDGGTPGRSRKTTAQSLLDVYIQQEEQARKDKESAAAKAPKTLLADPFAPFLKDWLAGSPVDASIFGALQHSAGYPSGQTPAAPADGPLMPMAADSAHSLGIPAAGAHPQSTNPFLQPLGLSSEMSSDPAAGSRSIPAVPAASSQPVPNPSNSSVAPPPAPVSRDRNPPPSVVEENRKYFPQMKRF